MTELRERIFAHSMLREIYEQPEALSAVLGAYLLDGSLNRETFQAVAEALRGRERIVIAASGSSRHAGLAAEIMLEDMAGLTVDVEYASEYCYRSTHTLQSPGVIVISQSGETADTLAALREGKSRGLPTLAITNQASSSMAREADALLPTCAGEEKAIPATKSFTTQLLVLYLLTLYLGRMRGRMTAQTVTAHCQELTRLPGALLESLPTWDAQAAAISEGLRAAASLLYLGRGIHYAIAREGALKMKESAYLQAEGYPAGELKHGPNALVSLGTPLVILATREDNDPDSVLRYRKVLQLIVDLREQGAEMIALTSPGDAAIAKLVSHAIEVPAAGEYLLPILEVAPLQLLAYHSAVRRSIDVDHPRNLMKAVVAE